MVAAWSVKPGRLYPCPWGMCVLWVWIAFNGCPYLFFCDGYFPSWITVFLHRIESILWQPSCSLFHLYLGWQSFCWCNPISVPSSCQNSPKNTWLISFWSDFSSHLGIFYKTCILNFLWYGQIINFLKLSDPGWLFFFFSTIYFMYISPLSFYYMHKEKSDYTFSTTFKSFFSDNYAILLLSKFYLLQNSG